MTGPNDHRSPTMDSNPIEQRLRAALAARADQFQDHDLRPAQAPRTQHLRVAPARPRRLLVTVAAAAVMVSAAAGIQVLNHSQHADQAPSVRVDTPPVLTFTTRTETIADRATLTYPVASVSGGAPGVDARIGTVLNGRVEDLVQSFRTRIDQQDPAAQPLMLQITPENPGVWRQFLSVRLDVLEDFGGAHPSNSAAAVVIDSRSGAAVGAEQVVPDVESVDRLMQASIQRAAGPTVDAAAVATLSMRPGQDGTTAPLAWYPAPDGLHWVVDRGAIAAEAAGTPSTVLAWNRLDR